MPKDLSAPSTGLRLPTRQVARRYGVAKLTVLRWEQDPELDFPRSIQINKKKFWLESELDMFDERHRTLFNAKSV